MADDTTTQATPETQPTLEDLKAIADKALLAAQEAKDEVAASKAAGDAAQSEAGARGLTLPPELVQQISDAMSGQVVEKLRAEFEVSNPLVPAAPDSSPSSTPTPGEDGTTLPAPSSDAPPATTRTWAQRFLGE